MGSIGVLREFEPKVSITGVGFERTVDDRCSDRTQELREISFGEVVMGRLIHEEGV